MDKYSLLIQEIENTKEKLKDDDQRLEKEENDYVSSIYRFEKEVNITKEEIEKKTKDLVKLLNFKKTIKKLLKNIGIISLIMFALGLVVEGIRIVAPYATKAILSVESDIESLNIKELGVMTLTTLISSLVLAPLAEFSDISKLHKLKKRYPNIESLEAQIKRLEKQLQFENKTILINQANLDYVRNERKIISEKLKQCDTYQAKLLEKIPYISHICRYDEEAINEAYSYDLDLLPAIKLVRENKSC